MVRNNLPKVVFLQGPPRCGKDTAAHLLVETYEYQHEKFAQPIVDAMQAQFSDFFMVNEEMDPPGTMDDFKSTNFGPYLNPGSDVAITGRDIMIAWSEKFMKPLFGDRVFGTLAARRIYKSTVFSDSGFQGEAEAIFTDFPPEECAIVALYRPGCTFQNDSRSYWSRPGIPIYHFMNNSETVDEFKVAFLTFFHGLST